MAQHPEEKPIETPGSIGSDDLAAANEWLRDLAETSPHALNILALVESHDDWMHWAKESEMVAGRLAEALRETTDDLQRVATVTGLGSGEWAWTQIDRARSALRSFSGEETP